MTLDINLNVGERPWLDCKHLTELGELTRIGRLPAGMGSGKSAVVFLVTMPDGKQFMAQTSMRLFEQAAYVLKFADEKENN